MNIWKEVHNVITPGGDTCWCCPVCGKGTHVYGVEELENYSQQCRDCGAELKYPWENEDDKKGRVE